MTLRIMNDVQNSVVKIVKSMEHDEYKVVLNNDFYNCYYTQDLQDAIDTAQSIGRFAMKEYLSNHVGEARYTIKQTYATPKQNREW